MCGTHARYRSRSFPSVLGVVRGAVALPIRVCWRAARVVLSPASNIIRSTVGQAVPFSNRRHIIIVPEWVEDLLGENGFAQVWIRNTR